MRVVKMRFSLVCSNSMRVDRHSRTMYSLSAFLLFIALILALILAPLQARANDSPAFSAYKPSFATFAFSDDDDTPLQVRFSARYRLLDCNANPEDMPTLASQLSCKYLRWPGRLRMYFSYTTDFDFYLGSDGDGKLRRQSRPVRNRMTSPALHLDWARKKPDEPGNLWLSNISTSLVHHSNGQDLEFSAFFDGSSTAQEITNTIAELERNQPSWMDGVSRGWNYLELKGKFYAGNGIGNCDARLDCMTIYADYKLPVTRVNDDIWWEPGNRSKYTDYNRVELTISNEWRPSGDSSLFRDRELSLQLQCGDRGCSAKPSYRLDWHPGNLKIPLFF